MTAVKRNDRATDMRQMTRSQFCESTVCGGFYVIYGNTLWLKSVVITKCYVFILKDNYS